MRKSAYISLLCLLSVALAMPSEAQATGLEHFQELELFVGQERVANEAAKQQATHSVNFIKGLHVPWKVAQSPAPLLVPVFTRERLYCWHEQMLR